MSASIKRRSSARASKRVADPRIVRSRASVRAAARTLFLEKGYAGTTMDEIAAQAGLAKRTVYNNYADKQALFTGIVEDVTAYADEFARELREDLAAVTAATARPALEAAGRRLALGILRPDVIALRRLLVGEAREFQALARRYYERAPGQVLDTLAWGFRRLARMGVLDVRDARRAAEQFAYLAAGAALDRAVLTGTIPSRARVIAEARDGVQTFIARYSADREDSRRLTQSESLNP